MLLEGADVVVAVAPEMLAVEPLGKLLARQHLGMHAHHQHVLIMRAR